MLDAVRAASREMMEDWLDANYEGMRGKLAELTASRYGVPYEQLFTQIWHYLFGMANRSLVESGHFADPYAEARVSKAFVPFVFEVDAFGELDSL